MEVFWRLWWIEWGRLRGLLLLNVFWRFVGRGERASTLYFSFVRSCRGRLFNEPSAPECFHAE